MVIGFLNQKGGVGKTTLAINLAEYLAKQYKTIAIDTDPQSSLTKFYRGSDNLSFKFAQSFLKDIKYKIKEEKDFDYYIVDTAGSANPDIFNIIDVFDLIIIPIQPSKIDIDSSLDLLNFIKNKNYKYLINSANHIALSAVTSLQVTFAKNLISYFSAFICNRKIYKDAFLEGKTIFDYENTQAINEFNKFGEEVLGYGKE